jgi:hypothetical protein
MRHRRTCLSRDPEYLPHYRLVVWLYRLGFWLLLTELAIHELRAFFQRLWL